MPYILSLLIQGASYFTSQLAKYPVFARESQDILWKAALLATSTFQCNGLISLQFALSRKNSKISVFRCRGSKWVPIEVNFEVVSRHNPWDFPTFFSPGTIFPRPPTPLMSAGTCPVRQVGVMLCQRKSNSALYYTFYSYKA